MVEIDYLKTILLTKVPPSVQALLNRQHDTTPNLWNVFCLLANGYADAARCEPQIRELIDKCADSSEYDVEYLRVIAASPSVHRRMGLAFGVVNKVSQHFNKKGLWHISGYNTYFGTYSGNGLSAFKHVIVKNPALFREDFGAFSIDPVEITKI